MILKLILKLTLCQEEMPSINFFGVSKETMTDVRRNLQKQSKDWKTIPGTRSSHHFTPLSPSQIGHMLTSEDDSSEDTFDFNLPTTLEITDIRSSTYVTCLHNSLWWVGMVTDVDAEQTDIKADFMHPHGPHKTFNWPQNGDTCYVSMKNIVWFSHLPHQLEDLIKLLM